MFEKEKSNSFYYIIIVIVCFFAFFIHNTAIPADLMESRNLATAQEMVREGNYLTPTMNGELRFEKPPLPTWVAAGVEHICPNNLAVQRGISAVMATVIILFLFAWVSYISKNKNIGLVAALICASSYNVVMMGRNATWDIYCHCFMLIAILLLTKAFLEDGRQWKNFIWAGVFMGLSFLSKGPVSFLGLLVPFIIALIAVYRPKMKGKITPLLVAILITLVLSFWWYGYLWLFHNDMLLKVTHKETTAWVDHNVRPFYYYWQFPAEGGIWALFWVTSIVYYFIKRRKERISDIYTFSIIWMFSSLVCLSLVPEKKPRYLLPLLVPGAIVIACYLYYVAKGYLAKWERRIFKINSGFIAFILIALPVAMYFLFVKEGLISIPLFIIISVLFVSVACYLVSGILKSRLDVQRVFTSIILSMIIVEGLCMYPIGETFVNPDRHSIQLINNEPRVKNLPFYYDAKTYVRMELVYEANKRIEPLDLSNDSLVYSKAPFVLVSIVPTDSLIHNKNVGIEYIDTFDNNWRKRGSKRYNEYLVSYVSIIRAAKE